MLISDKGKKFGKKRKGELEEGEEMIGIEECLNEIAKFMAEFVANTNAIFNKNPKANLPEVMGKLREWQDEDTGPLVSLYHLAGSPHYPIERLNDLLVNIMQQFATNSESLYPNRGNLRYITPKEFSELWTDSVRQTLNDDTQAPQLKEFILENKMALEEALLKPLGELSQNAMTKEIQQLYTKELNSRQIEELKRVREVQKEKTKKFLFSTSASDHYTGDNRYIWKAIWNYIASYNPSNINQRNRALFDTYAQTLIEEIIDPGTGKILDLTASEFIRRQNIAIEKALDTLESGKYDDKVKGLSDYVKANRQELNTILKSDIPITDQDKIQPIDDITLKTQELKELLDEDEFESKMLDANLTSPISCSPIEVDYIRNMPVHIVTTDDKGENREIEKHFYTKTETNELMRNRNQAISPITRKHIVDVKDATEEYSSRLTALIAEVKKQQQSQQEEEQQPPRSPKPGR